MLLNYFALCRIKIKSNTAKKCTKQSNPINENAIPANTCSSMRIARAW